MTSLMNRWSATFQNARTWLLPAVPTLVVAPHPDDEVLMMGGLIARQRRRGVRVVVIAVTDGEAAYDDVPNLADIRIKEQEAALQTLGVTSNDVVRLGLPDGHVAEHMHELTRAVRRYAGDALLVVAPWVNDHHCDHEAVGRAAVEASRDRGVDLALGFFWTWQHHEPRVLQDQLLLRLDLDPGEQTRRRAAVEEHASQITTLIAELPILSESDLEPVSWSDEYYLVQRAGMS